MAKDPPTSPTTATDDKLEYEGVAASTVFDIAELRESILIHLPMKTLMTSQRVNRNWQTTIRDCKQIQQKLFLRAKPSDFAFRPFDRYEGDEHEEPGENLIYDENYRLYAVEAVPVNSLLPGQKFALQADLHPLLYVASMNTEDLEDRATCGELVTFELSPLLEYIRRKDKGEPGTWLPGQARPSCLDMFLCQPPAKAVKLRSAGRIEIIRNQIGVTFDDIATACDHTSAILRKRGHAAVDANVRLFDPLPEVFDIKFAGILYHTAELGEASLFCSPDDPYVEDASKKLGVVYTWDAGGVIT